MTNIRSRLIAVSVAALATGLFGSGINAEVVVRGIEGKPLDDVRPAPEFFRPDLDVISAQPSPSERLRVNGAPPITVGSETNGASGPDNASHVPEPRQIFSSDSVGAGGPPC
jgi:hypothetical protein